MLLARACDACVFRGSVSRPRAHWDEFKYPPAVHRPVPIDFGQVAQSLMNGLAWGLGFSICFAIGLTYSVLAILGHPTLRKIASAAGKFGSGSRGWLGEILDFLKPPQQK